MREDIDCGLVEHKCGRCSKTFKRAKDVAYHERQCGDSQCKHCGKIFSCGEALKRHAQSHDPAQNKCDVCEVFVDIVLPAFLDTGSFCLIFSAN